ncbi:flagellar protein FliS [Azospirillum sp. RWY-5-1]|uniref:Flagellar protein FliS n=1 Tax=Azospirillum oleiclasticum TaxID=2735135 RepID=A0ABX2TFE0_9PROT|nr:flagellar export chaperone FliS [Azospirillum oleiclasticum]NYZ16171.1 flagellar protein FliS [Azospirillum oleiclasticum]NYZ23051.1 flagellar protein FliS [Azospirillum oleiclasticum]
MRNPYVNKALAAYAIADSAVPPLVAVVRLYEKALTHLHLAREAARERRFDMHFKHVERTILILSGLDSILDMDKGKDVAATLRGFYRSLIRQAGTMTAKRDPVAATDAVIRQLAIMAKTWQSIAAERGMVPTSTGAPAKGPHASVIGRSGDHAHGRILA